MLPGELKVIETYLAAILDESYGPLLGIFQLRPLAGEIAKIAKGLTELSLSLRFSSDLENFI